MIEKIITRPDFDGVACAVLIKAALKADLPVQWVQPNEIQNGSIRAGPQDVVANLPLTGDCALWFDHHVSNETQLPFKGIFRVAPSAAGLVYEYYQSRLNDRYRELVKQADKIDSAQLSLDEILHPERHPYVLLSMTVYLHQRSDQSYCDHLVKLLQSQGIDQVMEDPAVRRRSEQVVASNRSYKKYLKQHTRIQDTVSITDFRGLRPAPDGNRFLVYSLFPQAVVNVKIFEEDSRTAIKLGHSILNRGCRVNVGQLLARYGGGGHRGAGACRVVHSQAEPVLQEIIQILVGNQPIES